MKKTILIALLIAYSLSAAAQDSLSIYFPHFAGKYSYLAKVEDGGIDTLTRGVLNSEGRISFALPNGLAAQPRMLQCGIERAYLYIIVAGGNMGIECLDAMPSAQSIRYINAPQNTYRDEVFARQNGLLERYGALKQLQGYYPEAGTALGAALLAEQKELQEQYAALQSEIAHNPSFAARYLEIMRFMQGVPPSLQGDPAQWQAEQRRFAAHELDYSVLYRSDGWTHFGEAWLSYYTNPEAPVSDTELLADSRAILARTIDKKLYTKLAEMFARQLTKQGKDNVLNELAIDMSHSGRLDGAGAYLRSLTQVVTGSKVPAVAGLKKNPTLKGETTLLFFYDSHCTNCTSEMGVLRKQYAQLANKGIRVVSIAADSDPVQYESYASTFPWPDKLMDGKGIEGENFTNYGVMGTPTLLVVDKNGLLTGRYVNLKATGLH